MIAFLPWPRCRCSTCGRFVCSGGPVWVMTNWGSSYDLEPPDDIFICVVCWDKFDDRERARHTDTSKIRSMWIPASFLPREAKP